MTMSWRSKFLIPLQKSGRRWCCNVIGHYDHYLLGLDPKGTWVTGANPLRGYGTNKRRHIVPTHCNDTSFGSVELPRFYRLRPAAIIVRHPVKVAHSFYRGRRKAAKGASGAALGSLEVFVESRFLDYFVRYANEVYDVRGHRNKVLVSCGQLFDEQFTDNKPEWPKLLVFFLASWSLN